MTTLAKQLLFSLSTHPLPMAAFAEDQGRLPSAVLNAVRELRDRHGLAIALGDLAGRWCCWVEEASWPQVETMAEAVWEKKYGARRRRAAPVP